jgi:hypothetical protein
LFVPLEAGKRRAAGGLCEDFARRRAGATAILGRVSTWALSASRAGRKPEPLSASGRRDKPASFQRKRFMPKYVIERTLPGAGSLTADQLKGISQTSCKVLRNLGPQIQWVESYVTPDKIYCIYIAPDAELIRRHAAEGGFPCDSVSEIKRMIDPTTAD